MKYEVDIIKTITETVTIVVEADDVKSARVEAMKQAKLTENYVKGKPDLLVDFITEVKEK